MKEFVKTQHRRLEWMTDMLEDSKGESVAHTLLGRPWIIYTKKSENIKHMFKDNFENYTKGSLFRSAAFGKYGFVSVLSFLCLLLCFVCF